MLSDALKSASEFLNATSAELADASNLGVKQDVATLLAISAQFANQFTDLSGQDKKKVALFVASELVAKFTDVAVNETLGNMLDTIVSIARGKFDIAKMAKVAEDVKEIISDTVETVEKLEAPAKSCFHLCF
jgi:hypothetical protein